MTETTNSSISLERRILNGVTNWALLIAGLINLGFGTWFAAHADTTIAATTLTAGLILLFAATIDRFESLKGLGIEAKTRKLDEKIEQADEALDKVRKLAELTGGALIDLNTKVGRWNAAPSPRESLVLADRIRSILLGIGSEQSEIIRTLRPWALMICGDLAAHYAANLTSKVSQKINDLTIHRSALPAPLNPNDPELARVEEEIRLCNIYINQIRDMRQNPLEAFPKCFMSIFSNVPQIAQDELLPMQDKATRFAADMAILKQSMMLPNSETWMLELEEARLQGH